MAKAKSLRAGMPIMITEGPLKGFKAEVIDPVVVPDGQEHQRKILIKIHAPGGGTWDEYVIPKQVQPEFDSPFVTPVTPLVTHTPPAVAAVAKQLINNVSLDDPSLDTYRPSRPNIMKQYVSRMLPGNKRDIDIMLNYWRSRDDRGYADNVGLVGDTQSGKTMLVEVMAHVIAKEMGLSKPLPVFTLSGSSAITDHDLFGQYRPDSNNNLVWLEGLVALAARVGGILYLDEINAMPGNVTAALHPLLDDRRQFVNIRKPVDDGHGGFKPEVVNANTNLWVLCTYNPGYAGMSKTNEAFANRFRWLPWDYDEAVEEKLIKSPAIRLLGQALRLARETRAITTPIGTSALQRLERDVVSLEVDYALWAFMGQFTSKAEKARVETIIADRAIKALIEAEMKEEDTDDTLASATTTTTGPF